MLERSKDAANSEKKFGFFSDVVVFENDFLVKRVDISNVSKKNAVLNEINFSLELFYLDNILLILECETKGNFVYLKYTNSYEILSQEDTLRILKFKKFSERIKIYKRLGESLLDIHNNGVRGVGLSVSSLLTIKKDVYNIIFSDFTKANFVKQTEKSQDTKSTSLSPNLFEKDVRNLVYTIAKLEFDLHNRNTYLGMTEYIQFFNNIETWEDNKKSEETWDSLFKASKEERQLECGQRSYEKFTNALLLSFVSSNSPAPLEEFIENMGRSIDLCFKFEKLKGNSAIEKSRIIEEENKEDDEKLKSQDEKIIERRLRAQLSKNELEPSLLEKMRGHFNKDFRNRTELKEFILEHHPNLNFNELVVGLTDLRYISPKKSNELRKADPVKSPGRTVI